MNKAVFGLAKTVDQTERLIAELQNAGFSNDDISVLLPESQKLTATEARRLDASGNVIKEVNVTNTPKTKNSGLGHEKHSKASEGAAVGGLSGGIIGGTLGLLAGIGTLALPGFGAFIAAGPIMAALAGSAVGGSIGLLTGALVGLGIPEYEAVYYAEKLKDSKHILISVHTKNSSEIERAKTIFEKIGLEDISSSAETVASGSSKSKR